MCKSMYMLLVCVFVFSYGANAANRGTFQARLRHCRWLCAIRDSQQKNTLQTCLVLADHQNVTVTKCVSKCLQKHDENISNSTECQCQNGKCDGKSVNEVSSSSAPNSETSAEFSTSTPENDPTEPSSVPSSSEVPSSASSASAGDSSTLRLIEDFENDKNVLE